jgi:pSer/pThr/pTyr-binding forkhead associated (FHA) protein
MVLLVGYEMSNNLRNYDVTGYVIVGKKIFTITNERTTIGRSKKCLVVVNEPTASKIHAVIYSFSDLFFLKDCYSSNGFFFLLFNYLSGTYVNGQMVTSMERVDNVGNPVKPINSDLVIVCEDYNNLNNVENLKKFGKLLQDGSEISIGALTINFQIQLQKKMGIPDSMIRNSVIIKENLEYLDSELKSTYINKETNHILNNYSSESYGIYPSLPSHFPFTSPSPSSSQITRSIQKIESQSISLPLLLFKNKRTSLLII